MYHIVAVIIVIYPLHFNPKKNIYILLVIIMIPYLVSFIHFLVDDRAGK